MITLAFDSTAKVATVAVLSDERVIASYTIDNGFTQSELLLPMAEDMLGSLSLSFSNIGLFACSVGPGSFTGVRIGAALVKGLAFGKDKCVLGVSALEAMARTQLPRKGLIVPAMDARRGEVYTAVFRAEGDTLTRLMPDTACPAGDLEAWLTAHAAGEDLLAVGDGVPVLKKALSLPFAVAPAAIAEQHAVGVAQAAFSAYQAGARGTDRTLAPIYLRLPQAERERLAKEK